MSTTVSLEGKAIRVPAKPLFEAKVWNVRPTTLDASSMAILYVEQGTVGVRSRSKVATIGAGKAMVLSGRAVRLAAESGRPTRALLLKLAGVLYRSPRGGVVLDTTVTRTGEAIRIPAKADEVTVSTITISPRGSIPLHTHPAALFAYLMEGDLRLSTIGKPDVLFHKGGAFVESTLPHSGRNVGKSPVRLLAIYIGRRGEPLSVPSEPRTAQ